MAETSRGSRFEGLRKQARHWLRALRGGDEEALRRLEAQLPRHSRSPGLREVQQALAREQGFASWAALKEDCALEAAAADGSVALVDRFLEHACIFTAPPDFPDKWQRAERIRARHPEIATTSLHTAVVCGEVEHVERMLDARPGSISSPGGPQQWPPLLFACYGRLPDRRARERSLEVARLLLDRGADPDSHFVSDDDWKLRFTALTGAMGQGEMGQPEHPQAEALARLLLERGANPNDGQGLYNTHLVGDDPRWLELLIEWGLGPDDPIRWHADPAAAALSGADRCPSIFDYLASGAARNGHRRRLALLLEHGANPDAVSIYDGKTCYESALMHGDPAIVDLLRRHGARERRLQGHDAFVAAVRRGDREEARVLIERDPAFATRGDPLTEAARRGELAVVRALLELGVEADAESRHGHRALHNACEQREIARLLLAHGADPRARVFGGTPSAWARNGGNLEMARFHAEHSRSLLDAVACGHLALVDALLGEDPTCLAERDPAGNGPLHALPGDPAVAEPLVDALLAVGADREAKNDAGETPAQHLEAGGRGEVADLLATSRPG